MQITVNGRTIEVFSGAKVEDALRRYSAREWARVRKGMRTVSDAHGHEVGLDGELSDGQALITSARVPKEPQT